MMKKLLKKLLPHFDRKPAQSVQKHGGETQRRILAETEHILKSLEETKSDMQQFSRRLTELSDRMAKDTAVLARHSDALRHISADTADRFGKLYYHINETEHNMIKDTYYVQRFEKRFITGAFGDFKKAPDFEKRFLKLIHGLDRKSTDTVITALNRIEKVYYAEENARLDLYTTQEKILLRTLKEDFTDKILMVASGLYYYNGYFLPENSFEDSVFYYKNGIKELKHPDRLCKKDIIDAGGYIGDSLLMLSPLTGKTVYSFEPVRENFEQMQKTIAMNHIQNACPVHAALGDTPGTKKIYVAGSASTSNARNAAFAKRAEEAPCETLDHFAEEHGLTVGLIKADIEGAEQSLLRGAERTIRKDRPALMISIYHNIDDLLDIKPMIEAWNLGYEFRIYRPIIRKIASEIMLIAEAQENGGGAQ